MRVSSHPGRSGQVMIEFALAAAGIVLVAMIISRVANWLNQSLVKRNAAYQATRVEAASTNPGTDFTRPPGDLDLLGGGAGATSGAPSQQALGPSAALRSCPAAEQKLKTAREHRAEAQQLYEATKAMRDDMVAHAQQAEVYTQQADAKWADACAATCGDIISSDCGKSAGPYDKNCTCNRQYSYGCTVLDPLGRSVNTTCYSCRECGDCTQWKKDAKKIYDEQAKPEADEAARLANQIRDSRNAQSIHELLARAEQLEREAVVECSQKP